MQVEARLPTLPSRNSLRTKIVLGVALPIFVVLLAFSLFHYERERHLLETQVQLTARRFGSTVLYSLRHAMASNDPDRLNQILLDVDQASGIQRIQILDRDNRVKFDSLDRDVNRVLNFDATGCADCHRSSEPSLPHTIRLSDSQDVLRTVVPIHAGPECAGCHSADDTYLGLLLVDVSVAGVEQHILNDLRVDLLFSLGASVLVSLGIYVLMHRLVVRRVVALRSPLAAFAQGDFRARLPVSLRPSDEIDALVGEFNHMAKRLEQHAREQQALGELRQRAIVEERERIGRELHDGLAQLLGYVNTKAMAVRLMLKNRQQGAAEKHLLQLEEAAQALFVDVREAILGLTMTSHDGTSIVDTLKAYVTQFSRLSGLPACVQAAPEVECLQLPAEAQAQLLRIVQEALTNVRKHALAQRAEVNLQLREGVFELAVCDDGAGFYSGDSSANGWSHFGLRTMRERAEAIGAQLAIDPNPGHGTRVSVRLPLEGNEHYARAGR